MTLTEYQKQAKRTLGNATMGNILMGIFGEAGEVVDYLKKVIYHGHPLEKEKMVEELGDLLWYVVSPFNIGMVSIEGFKPLERVDGFRIAEVEIYCLANLLMSETARMIIEADYGCYLETPYPRRVVSIIHELARRVDSSIEEVAEHNIKKLQERYPNGFEKQRSINRY